MSNYEKQYINEISKDIKNEGFQVFIADSGTHGIYSNGDRVVSFQMDILSISFSGNYVTDDPKRTGTGWRIHDHISKSYKNIIEENPPIWAVRRCYWRFEKLEEHLRKYNSSKYKKV